MSERSILCLVLACWARTAGLTRGEASDLASILLTQALPMDVDQAWHQLDQATMEIRRSRHHEPPAQQQPAPWRDQ